MKHQGRLQILAERSFHRNSIELSFGLNRDRELWVAQPLQFVERVDKGQVRDESTISMSPDEAQLLMDELWTVGLRPSEGTGSAGALAATEKHLKDMRELAFGALRMTGVLGSSA